METYNHFYINLHQRSFMIVHPHHNRMIWLDQSIDYHTYVTTFSQSLKKTYNKSIDIPFHFDTRMGILRKVPPGFYVHSHPMDNYDSWLQNLLYLTSFFPLIVLSQVSIHFRCTQMYRIHRIMGLCKNSRNKVSKKWKIHASSNHQLSFIKNGLLGFTLLHFLPNISKHLTLNCLLLIFSNKLDFASTWANTPPLLIPCSWFY